MSWVAAAVVGGAVVGGVVTSQAASKSASATKSATQTATAAEERIAAKNLALNKERYSEAQRLLRPYIADSNFARNRLTQELMGKDGAYVPGRDDIRPLETQYTDPTSTIQVNPINPRTGEEWQSRDYTETDGEREIRSLVVRLRNYGNILPEGEGEEYFQRGLKREGGYADRLMHPGGETAGLYQDVTPESQMVGDPVRSAETVMDDVSAMSPTGSPYISAPEYMEDITSGFEGFMDLPVYQRMAEEGSRAAEARAAASGMLKTGSMLDELRTLGQGVQSQAFGDYLGLRGDVQNVNEQRFTNYMNLSEQRDVNRRNTEEQRYANYINTLQGLGSPATATNLASMGVGQAANIAQQQSQSVGAQNQLMMQGVAAQNAARADQARAIGNIAGTAGGAYMMSQNQMPAGFQPSYADPGGTMVNATTGTISPNYR